MPKLIILMAAAVAGLADDKQRQPELMLAQAKAMTTAQLAGVLLPNSRVPIVETFVHPLGMEAPASWVTQVDLVSEARPSTKSGFCSAEHYTVSFTSTVEKNPDFRPVAARPSSTTSKTVYRLPSGGQRPSLLACKSSLYGFFNVTAESRDRSLLIMRLLEAGKIAARRGQISPFPITFTDQMPDDFDRLARDHSAMLTVPSSRISQPAAAFAALPLSAVFNIDLNPRGSSFTLKDNAILAKDGSKLSLAQVSAGSEWIVDVAYHETGIDALHIVRRIPPPF